MPSRISNFSTQVGVYPALFHPTDNSVSHELWSLPSIRRPFITHINMGPTNRVTATNACKAYIDKLEYFGTNYSPGRLKISANAGGYGNNNYYFDDSRYSSLSPPPPPVPAHGSNASNAVVYAGIAPSSVIYSNAFDTNLPPLINTDFHISTATNMAGYLCHGVHSSLEEPTRSVICLSGMEKAAGGLLKASNPSMASTTASMAISCNGFQRRRGAELTT